MTHKMTEIEKIEKELKAHNERSRALRNELKKARESEITELQNAVISSISSALFSIPKNEKLDERLARFQLLKAIFEDWQILENLRETSSRFLSKTDDVTVENVTVENAENGDFAVTEFAENSRDFDENHDTDFWRNGEESE